MALPIAIFAKSRLTVGLDFITGWTLDPDPNIPAAPGDVTTDLTGASVVASIVDTDEDATVIVASDAISGAIDADERSVVLSIAAADTADIVPGIYRWRVHIVLSGGTSTYPVATGPVQVWAA